jgi:agmatinase
MGLTGVLNFGGLEGEEYATEEVRFSILPVPYDLTSSYVSGARNGPVAIIEASTHMETYDEELCLEPWKAGIETLPMLEATTLGPGEMVKKVRFEVAGILERGKIPVILGGEHSVTIGLVMALTEIYPDLSVLQLDAHADLRESYQDSPFNHACVARRISELCPIVQVGTRSLSSGEAEFLKSMNRKDKPAIKAHYATEIIKGVSWGEVVEDLTDDVFITIDLDVFDPSIMPATGTPEPGGLGWYDVLGLLRTVAAKKRVVGFDVVELCPIPGNVAPDFLAAKLAYKVMGYINEGLDVRERRG